MTQSFLVLPDGDVENDGWTFFGGLATKIWEAVGFLEDDCGIICPSYRGGAQVSFPVDVGDLPEGAIIDSITVFCRMKTNAGSGPRSVTVNVLSSQNASRFTTRTLHATSAFTTFEVGTYTRDPLGHAWDIHRLNHLRLRCFSFNNLFDSIRISQLYCQINFHTRPTVTVSSPSGTVLTPSPTVSWTYRQLEGEPQRRAEYRIFTAAQAAVLTFSPHTAPPVYATHVHGQASSYTLPTSLNPDAYVVYVRVTSQFGAKSKWVSRAFSIQGPAPGVPGDDNAGIAGTPGVGVPTVVPDSFTSSAQMKMRDSSNLLSVQQADFEIATDPIEYVGTNCLPERSTAQAFGEGIASMVMEASSATDMTATTTPVEVSPEAPVTVRTQVKAAATARTVHLVLKEYDATWALVAENTVATITDATDTWTELVGNRALGATTVRAEVMVWVVAPAGAEEHYADHVGLMYGTNTAWSDGGHQSRNMLTSFLATGDDPAPPSDAWVQTDVATTTQRVTATGTGAHGLKTNQMTYVGASGSLAFRATGSVFTTPTAGVNYTLNKPTGLADNDLMLAFVTSTEHGTITPPVGWAVVNTASVDDGSTDIALWVLKRTGLAADPTTWTDGTVSASSSRRTAVVVAYSGAAHQDEQFIAENVKTDASGALTHQTQTVDNTDPNAWRVAAFAASDNVSGGTYTANITAPSEPSKIRYVGAATAWSTTNSTTTFQINKPANVQSGDLMVASFCCVGVITTVTAPSGWTLVRKTTRSGASFTLTNAVFKRTAGSSEPNSWAGSLSSATRPMMTQASAYRNCLDASQQFLAEDSSTDVNDTDIRTATISNTNSSSWRIAVMSASREPSYDGHTPKWSSTEVAERSDGTRLWDEEYAVNLAMYDSNGTVSTGNHSRSGTLSRAFSSAISWIGLIKGLTSPPAQGANETERVDNANGSSNPWMSTAVYDSNGVVAAGQHSVYGIFDPGGTDAGPASSTASWIGVIRPATAVQAGTVTAHTNTMIDLSNVAPEVLEMCQGKVSVTAQFLGSASGTPVLTLEFFRANHKISEVSTPGNAFGSSVWTKSWAVMDLPAGTTRIRPRLSALGRVVSDTVQFDRVGVMLGAPEGGDEVVWRNGTARPEHPIWTKPIIEYQDDPGTGYSNEWLVLPGQKATRARFDVLTGAVAYTDHTIVPLHNRRYRVQTLSYGLRGDVFASGFSPPSDEASFTELGWWLKNIHDLSMNMPISVKREELNVTTANTAVTFQPLGEKYPLVITEGYKSDTFTINVHVYRDEYASLKRLLNSGQTLLLQSDVDHSWWVRPVGDPQAAMLDTGSRTVQPRRYVTLSFVEVAPEE